MLKKIQNQLVNRFLDYVKIDTESDDASLSTPSTKKQFDLAKLLEKELNSFGLTNVVLTDKCYVTATLPSNVKRIVPAVGFIAHMDTSPEMSGSNVKPRIFENYDGNDIMLNKSQVIKLMVSEFPILKNYKGKSLITSDGTTLLGADNKAGIAEIMTAVSYLVSHPEIEHGDIQIGFTPDEEIGRGADHFDVKGFNADFAFTVDSGEIGSLEYETFNAASAKIVVTGKNVHPGTAKGVMRNAQYVAIEFNAMLPAIERPEHTEGYEGFYHLLKMNGSVGKAELQYIVRDHNKQRFESKKKEMQRIADFLNSKYGLGTVALEMKDQYYNMREKLEPVFHIVELAKSAYKKAGINPRIEPVRGGTDGARLSFMGLPTPNIFTGGHNFHSRYEFIVVESMLKAVEVIINIIELAGKK